MASVGPPTNTINEQRRLREAHAKDGVMHDQLLIDVQALHTSVQGADWPHHLPGHETPKRLEG